MNYQNHAAVQNDQSFSYQPMPFFDDMKQNNLFFNKKLDLNLYCIRRPQQTCFIRVTNPNMLAWGIDVGDMLIVEKIMSYSLKNWLCLKSITNFMCMSLSPIQTANSFSYRLIPKPKILKSPTGANSLSSAPSPM